MKHLGSDSETVHIDSAAEELSRHTNLLSLPAN